ncbi:rhomboid-like protein [Streptomyces sp. NPDC002643]
MDAAERVESGERAAPVGGPVLDGIPRQPGVVARSAPVVSEPETKVESVDPARRVRPVVGFWFRLRRLPPGPKGTPFTFCYATVLVVTSVVAGYADPALVHALHQGSSTDVAHLVQNPMFVLLASALWVAGGVGSPYVLGFLVVLTALERRVGGVRTAAVFLLGHVLATLATEVPVGLAVAVGHLPESSLHRLDYGISFGVAASAGALAGLLPAWVRRPVLVLFGGMLVDDLIAFSDPMTNWGHLMSLAIGVATWPVVRRWAREAGARAAAGAGMGAGTGAGAGRTPGATTLA